MGGMDILGPLPKALGVVKYLLVAIDYFTKWIEARPLQEITTNEWRNSPGNTISVGTISHMPLSQTTTLNSST